MSVSMRQHQRQLALKPQDLVVALKLAVARTQGFKYVELAKALFISSSEAHAAVARAEKSRLVIRDGPDIYPAESAVMEFVIHGVKYAFPGQIGTLTRGMATSGGAPPLKAFFAQSDEGQLVWPDKDGQARGIALTPLYPTVPSAARNDRLLYESLALVDAIRVGSARERELATSALLERLT